MSGPLRIRSGGLHLFQGDSITDCARSRDVPGSLGSGYALMVAAQLQYRYPQQGLRFLNRGCSGHRAKDLLGRWTEDCIALQPDTLSILIGINDVWRRYDQGDATSCEEFESTCRSMLQRVRSETTAQIVLLEPFLLHVPEDRPAWREDLDPKRAAVRKLAQEFQTGLIPLDEIFASFARATGPSYWAGDGVHPTPAGHALIAAHLLSALEVV